MERQARTDKFTEEVADRFAGYTVYDRSYEKIGSVDDLFVDENDSPEYIGVKMGFLVHLQDRFWAMSCSAAYESAERTTRSLVNAHKASLSITQKVS